MSNEKIQGTVKWYDETKGYGFISPDSGKKDLFFHRTAIDSTEKSVDKGERVEFEIQKTPRGEAAVHVRSIQSEYPA